MLLKWTTHGIGGTLFNDHSYSVSGLSNRSGNWGHDIQGSVTVRLMIIVILLVVSVMLNSTTIILHSNLLARHKILRAQKLIRVQNSSISEFQVMATAFSIL